MPGTRRRIPRRADPAQRPFVPSGITAPPGFTDLETQTETALLMAPPDTTPYRPVEVAGQTFDVRVPKPTALHTFQAAVSPHMGNDKVRYTMTSRFVRQHLSEESYEKLIVGLITGSGFTVEDMAALLESIATLGTSRPSKPSRISRSRRRHNGG